MKDLIGNFGNFSDLEVISDDDEQNVFPILKKEDILFEIRDDKNKQK